MDHTHGRDCYTLVGPDSIIIQELEFATMLGPIYQYRLFGLCEALNVYFGVSLSQKKRTWKTQLGALLCFSGSNMVVIISENLMNLRSLYCYCSSMEGGENLLLSNSIGFYNLLELHRLWT